MSSDSRCWKVSKHTTAKSQSGCGAKCMSIIRKKTIPIMVARILLKDRCEFKNRKDKSTYPVLESPVHKLQTKHLFKQS